MFRGVLLQPLFLLSLSVALGMTSLAGQQLPPAPLPPGGDFAEIRPDVPPVSLPTDVILVKGAEPSASDHTTPLPEDGGAVKNVYLNRYFDLTYPLPSGWYESFKGPPPSDSGLYVLANILPSPSFTGPAKGTILFSAQDMFFARLPVRDAKEMVAYKRDHLEPYYRVERPPAEVTIAGHPFVRFDYGSAAAGLHWVILATQIRCHAVEFVLSSRDPNLLESLVTNMDQMTLPKPDANVPVCIRDYATGANVITRVDPVLTDRRMNTIPVRIIIDKRGRVRHVHVLSAFREQSEKITAALLQWTFKPYSRDGAPAEVETGLMFGYTPRVTVATGSHTD